MADLTCPAARVELSARLDGETDDAVAAALDRHLESCDDCAAHEAEITRVRRTLRAQPAGPVPDLAAAILERVEAEAASRGSRSAWRGRARVAATAAVAAALVVVGASLPGTRRPPQVAGAAEISHRMQVAARMLTSVRASFAITERGWHPLVPVRRFTADVLYSAPERFALSVRDHTRYPGPGVWPRNDVDVVANPHRWWIREPTTCPTAALPGCVAASDSEQRTVWGRQPFDGASALPTDIVIPLETLATSGAFDVVGRERVIGRDAYRVELPYRLAVPLVMALEPGGSWRTFRPSDRVEVWIDARTWFPLRYRVVRAGTYLLSVRATSFAQPRAIDRRAFRAPHTGLARTGGFRERAFRTIAGRAPAVAAGLPPYRAGVAQHGERILAFADGVAWLKMTAERPSQPSMLYGAEEVHLGGSGYAYYEPGTDSLRRRVDVFAPDVHVHLESNLPRRDLLAAARSLDIRGRRLPLARRQNGVRERRLVPGRTAPVGFALTPAYLPSGLRASAAFLSRSRNGRATVTAYYRGREAEFGGAGVRITQARPQHLLPPTSETTRAVRIGGLVGRWTVERSELEWIDHGTYRAVAAPSYGLAGALRVALGLR